MELYQTKIAATGIYAPKKVLTNVDLEKIVSTSDDWIFERTGIRQRHVCSTEGGEFPTDMALSATLDALADAKMQPNDIEMILFATTTPDMQLPNSASLLQTKLGITNQCACLDIAAACSGMVYGINMAHALIQVGQYKNILIVGSEMLSREVNWKDRNICILFGDGCGVALLTRAEAGESSAILSTVLEADGTGKDYFLQPHGGAVSPITHEILEAEDQYMQMKGKEMFKVATRTLAQLAQKAIQKANIKLEDVDWVVPHQANARIIETTAKMMGVPYEKFVVNIEKFGNTSAASIPLAFHEAIKEGRIKRGDIVLFDAFGAGLTAGATLFRY